MPSSIPTTIAPVRISPSSAIRTLQRWLTAADRRSISRDELDDRIQSLEETVRRIDEEVLAAVSREGPLARDVARVREAVDAIVRRLYVAPLEPDFPSRLLVERVRVSSQNEEDGVTLALLRGVGVARQRFAEIGCGQNGGNSGVLARELGWSGLMVDSSQSRIDLVARRFNPERVRAVAKWVTREGIDDLLRKNGLEGEIDFYSIDIDGNDYWVWEATTAIEPRVVVVEVNQRFGPDRAVTVPYDPHFDRHTHGAAYYGASLTAMVALGARKGYRLVAVEPRGINAFFVRNDLAPHIPAVSPRDVYIPLVRKVVSAGTAGKGSFTVVDEADALQALIERKSLELVDVGDR
jgi:hypothetical protein